MPVLRTSFQLGHYLEASLAVRSWLSGETEQAQEGGSDYISSPASPTPSSPTSLRNESW